MLLGIESLRRAFTDRDLQGAFTGKFLQPAFKEKFFHHALKNNGLQHALKDKYLQCSFMDTDLQSAFRRKCSAHLKINSYSRHLRIKICRVRLRISTCSMRLWVEICVLFKYRFTGWVRRKYLGHAFEDGFAVCIQGRRIYSVHSGTSSCSVSRLTLLQGVFRDRELQRVFKDDACSRGCSTRCSAAAGSSPCTELPGSPWVSLRPQLVLDSQKRVFSWGFGGYGRLGHAEQKDEMVPRLVKLFDFPGRGAAQIYAGYTCSFAVSETGGWHAPSP